MGEACFLLQYVRDTAGRSALLVNVILSAKIIGALDQRNSLATANEQQTDIMVNRNQVGLARIPFTNNVVFLLLHELFHDMNVINNYWKTSDLQSNMT